MKTSWWFEDSERYSGSGGNLFDDIMEADRIVGQEIIGDLRTSGSSQNEGIAPHG
jgi:hypothetical protein